MIPQHARFKSQMACYSQRGWDTRERQQEMFRRILEALGRRAKGDASFGIDESLSGSVLLGFMMHRVAMALRGLVLALRTHHPVWPVFVGRRVVVTNARYLRLSRGVSIGDYCRLDCLGRTGIVLGPGTTLRRGVQIEVTSTLKEIAAGCVTGARVGISEGTFIGAKGPVTIGDDTDFGPGCRIIAENHSFDDPDTPIREQALVRKGIDVGKDCWLGANVVVLDGCSIGDGTVIGAGAVVTSDVASGVVAAGVPAKVIRVRGAKQTAAH
jgi:acetyltransferase-like isoleucine patch superfamily enzyme